MATFGNRSRHASERHESKKRRDADCTAVHRILRCRCLSSVSNQFCPRSSRLDQSIFVNSLVGYKRNRNQLVAQGRAPLTYMVCRWKCHVDHGDPQDEKSLRLPHSLDPRTSPVSPTSPLVSNPLHAYLPTEYIGIIPGPVTARRYSRRLYRSRFIRLLNYTHAIVAARLSTSSLRAARFDVDGCYVAGLDKSVSRGPRVCFAAHPVKRSPQRAC